MAYLYILAQYFFFTLTIVGHVSTVGGDFLETGISHQIWGFITLGSTLLTVVFYSLALQQNNDFPLFLVLREIFSVLLLLVAFFGIVPVFMVVGGSIAASEYNIPDLISLLYVPIFFAAMANAESLSQGLFRNA